MDIDDFCASDEFHNAAITMGYVPKEDIVEELEGIERELISLCNRIMVFKQMLEDYK
mgnify:CR=1 FL=1